MRIFAIPSLAIVFCCLVLHPVLGAIGAPKSADRPTALRGQVIPADTIVTYSYDANGNRTPESGQALQTVLSNGAVTVSSGGEESITGSGNVVKLNGLSATLMVNGIGNPMVSLAPTADQLILTQSGADAVSASSAPRRPIRSRIGMRPSPINSARSTLPTDRH